jgi:hypothetical protein
VAIEDQNEIEEHTDTVCGPLWRMNSSGYVCNGIYLYYRSCIRKITHKVVYK